MQNILFNLHVAPNLINHCSTFSNFLILDSSGEAEMARTEQTAYLFCVVFTLRCQGHQALADTKYDLLNQGKCCDHNNKSPHHQFREFELQICQCPEIQPKSNDRIIQCTGCLIFIQVSVKRVYKSQVKSNLEHHRQRCQMCLPFPNTLIPVDEQIPWQEKERLSGVPTEEVLFLILTNIV